MWRHLLWTYCVEESLHVRVVREVKRVSVGVVRMLITLAHLSDFVRVEALPIRLFIFGFRPIKVTIDRNVTREIEFLLKKTVKRLTLLSALIRAILSSKCRLPQIQI